MGAAPGQEPCSGSDKVQHKGVKGWGEAALLFHQPALQPSRVLSEAPAHSQNSVSGENTNGHHHPHKKQTRWVALGKSPMNRVQLVHQLSVRVTSPRTGLGR